MSMCRASLALLEAGVFYFQCVLLAKLYQPLPCFIWYSKAKFAYYTRYLLSSYFCIPVSYKEKVIFFSFFFFFWCSFQKLLQVFIDMFNFRFFSVTGWNTDLDYCDIEWFALETNRYHSVIFEIASKCCISSPRVFSQSRAGGVFTAEPLRKPLCLWLHITKLSRAYLGRELFSHLS